MPVLPAVALAALLATAATPTPSPATASGATPSRPSLTLGSGRNSVHSQGYTLHFSAIPTTALSPAVAAKAGILRSSNRALLNVALRKGRAAEAVAVAARIEGRIRPSTTSARRVRTPSANRRRWGRG